MEIYCWTWCSIYLPSSCLVRVGIQPFVLGSGLLRQSPKTCRQWRDKTVGCPICHVAWTACLEQNLWCEDLLEPMPVRKLYLLHVLASESAWCRQKALLRHVLKRIDAQIDPNCMLHEQHVWTESVVWRSFWTQACEEIVFVACISVWICMVQKKGSSEACTEEGRCPNCHVAWTACLEQNLWCEDLFEAKPVRKLYLLHVLASESAWCRQKVLLRHVLKRVDAQIVCCMSSMFGQNVWCEDLFEAKPVRKLYLLHVLASECAWCRERFFWGTDERGQTRHRMR